MQTHLLGRSLLTAAFLILTFTLTFIAERPAAAEHPSIAVLPFANLSGDAEQDYLSNVVTDSTVKTLSKVGGLFVLSGGSPAGPGQASARSRQRT
jgi:adenylate cyclase